MALWLLLLPAASTLVEWLRAGCSPASPGLALAIPVDAPLGGYARPCWGTGWSGPLALSAALLL